MKRSKSALTHKNKREPKSAGSKQPEKTPRPAKANKGQRNMVSTPRERPHTARNTFEDRLSNIRRGFDQLERNLNSVARPCYEPQLASNQKVPRKLFTHENTSKTPARHKAGHKKSLTALSPSREGYHSCPYEKSLLNLMKIVVMQRNEIARLNKQARIVSARRQGTG